MPTTVPSADPFSAAPPQLRAALARQGFTSLTAVQRAVLDAESAGRDLRISSQTGSGKTVALGLLLAPSLVTEGAARTAARRPAGPAALLIAPTRELAVQVGAELRWLYADLSGVAVAVVTGGTDPVRERSTLERGPAFVVGTPGRLLDHIRRGALDVSGVAHVVLDEADQMLDMGFREDLDAIVDHLPAERRAHVVSAMFPPAVRAFAGRFQPNALHVEGTRLGAANEDIAHVAHLVRPTDRYATLVNLLLRSLGQRTLVFVRRRVDATEVAERLTEDGFSAAAFSGELSQVQRTRTLHAFRNGTLQALISTDVAARGIDIPGISSVVHLDLPTDGATYTHRSGRTGRAGQKGLSVLLVPTTEHRRVEQLFARAPFELSWQPPPTAAEVRKAHTKRTRRRLHGLLDASADPQREESGGDVVEATTPGSGDPPLDKHREYAKRLLEERDATEVVAALLALSEPPLPRDPIAIEAVRASGPRERDRRPPRHRGDDGRRRSHQKPRGAPRKGKRFDKKTHASRSQRP